MKLSIEKAWIDDSESRQRTVAKTVSSSNVTEVLYTVPEGKRFRGHAVAAFSGTYTGEIYVNGLRAVVSYVANYQTYGYPLPLELNSGDVVSGYNAGLVGVEYDA